MDDWYDDKLVKDAAHVCYDAGWDNSDDILSQVIYTHERDYEKDYE